MDEIHLTSKQFVWLFDITRETLRHWREKGLPYNRRKKIYPLKASLDWVRETIWQPKDEFGDINREKLLRERAKRIQDECKADELQKNLVRVDEVGRQISVLVAEAYQSLDGLPRRLAPVLFLQRDQKSVEIILRNEHREILRKLSTPVDLKQVQQIIRNLSRRLRAAKSIFPARHSKRSQKRMAPSR